jgi:hypothetical protein
LSSTNLTKSISLLDGIFWADIYEALSKSFSNTNLKLFCQYEYLGFADDKSFGRTTLLDDTVVFFGVFFACSKITAARLS